MCTFKRQKGNKVRLPNFGSRTIGILRVTKALGKTYRRRRQKSYKAKEGSTGELV